MKNPFRILSYHLPAEILRGELAVALMSGVIFVLAHLPALTNPYIINDDVRQQIYWMQQWQDPSLFLGDFLTGYARHYVPWGIKALYWVASWAVSPLYFAKILPGILFVFLAICLFKIGTGLSDRRLGWMMVAVYWLMPFFLDNLAGGLARAFAAPLLAFLWLGWQEKRPLLMGIALLLQALFIPYIFMISAPAVLLSWLLAQFNKDTLPPFPVSGAHFFILCLGGAVVIAMNLQLTTDGYGPLVWAREMVHRPEFYVHGRYRFLPEPSLLWELVSPWELIPPFREWGIAAGSLVCVGLLSSMVAGILRLDWSTLRQRLKPAGYLGLASLTLYFLARLFLLQLFVPDRYIMYTLNLFYCLLLALALKAAFQIERWPRHLAILALVAAAGFGVWRLEGIGLKDYSAYQALYSALAATPKDALMAGHPNLMDTIPTFAKRRAFATYELAHPWSRGYWARLSPRLHDLFQAYYAIDPQMVIDFCRKYGVTFFIVDDRHFSPAFLEGGDFGFPYERPYIPGTSRNLVELERVPFFAPFDKQIKNLTADRHNFALLSDSRFNSLALDRHIRLIDMRPWLNTSQIPSQIESRR